MIIKQFGHSPYPHARGRVSHIFGQLVRVEWEPGIVRILERREGNRRFQVTARDVFKVALSAKYRDCKVLVSKSTWNRLSTDAQQLCEVDTRPRSIWRRFGETMRQMRMLGLSFQQIQRTIFEQTRGNVHFRIHSIVREWYRQNPVASLFNGYWYRWRKENKKQWGVAALRKLTEGQISQNRILDRLQETARQGPFADESEPRPRFLWPGS